MVIELKDFQLSVLKKAAEELQTIEGFDKIDNQEKLEAFLILANNTIDEMIQYCDLLTQETRKSREEIIRLSSMIVNEEASIKETDAAHVGAAMLIEDEVEQILEEK